MVATPIKTATPSQYVPAHLDLPLPLDHPTWATIRQFEPLVAQALGDRPACILSQLHYWLEKECGEIYFGFRWIYNGYKEWHQQFPWLSEYTIAEIFRGLERKRIIVSNNFNRHRDLRLKWYTIDYYQLALQTGYNPYGLDLNQTYRRPPTEKEVIRWKNTFHLASDVETEFELPDWLDESQPLPRANVEKSKTAEWEFSPLLNGKIPELSIYKSLPKITKSNPGCDVNKNAEESHPKAVSQEPQVEILSQNSNPPASLSLLDEEKNSAAPVNACSDINGAMNSVAGILEQLQSGAAEREHPRPEPQRRPIRIPDLDEEGHEILWKYQQQLLDLNVDLDADRIRNAIADNPQHLENAILALIEDSGKGKKTVKDATGFFYNALRNGWKPRQGHVQSVTPPYFTAPPEYFEERHPPTLEQVLVRKQAAWNAPTLRPGVEQWAKTTPGIVLTEDGPVLAEGIEAETDPSTLADNSAGAIASEAAASAASVESSAPQVPQPPQLLPEAEPKDCSADPDRAELLEPNSRNADDP